MTPVTFWKQSMRRLIPIGDNTPELGRGTELPYTMTGGLIMKLATRILVPVDVRSVQWQSLDYAELVAAQSGAIMDLLYVLPDSDRWSLARKNAARQALLSIIATLKERHSSPGAASNGATPRPPAFVGFIQHGDPAEAILEFTSLVGHDVIVMGTHGRTGLSHLIRGSVAETVVRLAESPVLVVPGIRLQAAG